MSSRVVLPILLGALVALAAPDAWPWWLTGLVAGLVALIVSIIIDEVRRP